MQELAPQQIENRLKKAKEFLRLTENGELPNLVFSDEKTLVVQQFVNKQNYRVYLPKRSAENVHLRLATRTQAPAMMMVWAPITVDSRSPLAVIDRGSRIIAVYFRENILEGVLKPWGHVQILAANLGHSNRTQHHRTLDAPPNNGYKWFLASFPPQIGHQNLRIAIH